MAITLNIDGKPITLATVQDVLDVDNRVSEMEAKAFNNEEQIRLVKQILNGATPPPEPVREGITVGPDDNLQEAILDAGGQKIWLKDGIYQSFKVVSNTRMQAINPGKAVVDGTMDWSSGWVKGTGVETWYKELRQTFYQHPASKVHNDNGKPTARGLAHREAMRPQMLLWKGKVMQPVYESKDLITGTFMLEGTSEKPVGLWAKFEHAPTAGTVRLGVHQYLVKGMTKDVKGVELDDIVFQHCANTGVHGGLDMDSGMEYWKVNNCDFLWTMSEGARLSGKHHKFTNCRFNDNGHVGMALEHLYKSEIIDCETNRNVWRRGIDPLWHAGGFKGQYGVNHCLIENHTSKDNDGAGGWLDIDNIGTGIINPMFDNNKGFGLMIELRTKDGVVIGGYVRNTRAVDLGSRKVQADLRLQSGITGYIIKDLSVGSIYYKKVENRGVSGGNTFENVKYSGEFKVEGNMRMNPDEYRDMVAPAG